MNLEPLYRLTVDGFPNRFRVTRVVCLDRLHHPFSLEVTSQAVDSQGDLVAVRAEDLLGCAAELQLSLVEGGHRSVHGVVDTVERRYGALRLVIVPRIAPLDQAVDHQVFVAKDAVAVASEVLTEHRIDLDVRVTRALPTRPQCVQAFESDLAFVSRILADEGITWFVEHASGKDVVVLVDHTSGFSPISGDSALRFAATSGLSEAECVFDARLTRSLVQDAVRLRDYDFEHPQLDQEVQAKDGPGALARLEVPGGYRDPTLGKNLAGLRLEELRVKKLVLVGKTNCRRFTAGSTFTLEGAPRDDLNRAWLLLEVRDEAHDFGADKAGERRYEAEFLAIPAEAPYRPARGKAPTLGGVQTATVTGPAGTEIHTDRHGQMTSLLRWDRRRPKNEASSRWVRSLQPQTSGGMFLPRVGWEVLLGFAGTSGDVPYALGRLDNGAAPPAEALPAQKVRGAFGSRTTPGGGGGNVFRTDDAAGNEGMLLNASSDYNERTESDKTVGVKANDTHRIGANRTQIVGSVQTVHVDGAQSYSVGATRSVTVGGSMEFGLGSESISVGGMRSFDVGGDYSTEASGTLNRLVGAAKMETAIEAHNRHVSGGATVLIAGAWNEIGGVSSTVGVAGAHIRAIKGALNIKTPSYTLTATALKESFGSHTVRAGGGVRETFRGAGSLSIDGSATMKGSKVIVKASTKLTITAAGTTIEMTPSSITINGPFDSGVATKVTGTEKTE